MVLKLKEYAFNGSSFESGSTLILDPAPNSIEKSVKVEWRSRHVGLYSLYPRCKYRYRRTVEYTLKGGCDTEKRREIEFYAMRYSKFLVDNETWSKVVSPEYYSDRNTNPSTKPWEGEGHGNQTLYVMFNDCTFTLPEGKEDWFSYSIKVQVVNNEGIQ